MMILVDVRTQTGEALSIDLSDLVYRVKALSSARLLPPMKLINDLLLTGSARYDHWRQVSWTPFSLNEAEYAELCGQLTSRYSFSASEFSGSCDDHVLWSAVQTSKETGKSVDQVYPILKKIDVLERLMELIRRESDGAVDDDLVELISVKLHEATMRL